MAKVKRVRTKACSQCDDPNDVLYRVKVESDSDWIFVCPVCLDKVKPRQPAPPVWWNLEEQEASLKYAAELLQPMPIVGPLMEHREPIASARPLRHRNSHRPIVANLVCVASKGKTL